MLFVVTAVFTVAFLPAWLMAHKVIRYNMIVFYMYFSYNVANPIIYAFMNRAFRRDLREVFGYKAVPREVNCK
jgi:cholecystokinin A receptor/hypocretin (orexin) receptor 2